MHRSPAKQGDKTQTCTSVGAAAEALLLAKQQHWPDAIISLREAPGITRCMMLLLASQALILESSMADSLVDH